MNNSLTIAIPTRDRPDYVAMLLGSIVPDARSVTKVLIIENGPVSGQTCQGVAARAIELVGSLGILVEVVHIGDGGRQASQARNMAQIMCDTDLLMCVDDDMWFEPGSITRMVKMFSVATERADGCPIVLSALTPYVGRDWIGPKAHEELPCPVLDEKTIEIIPTPGQADPFKLILRQNCAYSLRGFDDVDALRPSDALTPGVYMMRPDIRVPNWDTSDQSLYTDIAWSLQLDILLGYKFYFDLGSLVYHLHAQHGGTRLSNGNFEKPLSLHSANMKAIEMLLMRGKKC